MRSQAGRNRAARSHRCPDALKIQGIAAAPAEGYLANFGRMIRRLVDAGFSAGSSAPVVQRLREAIKSEIAKWAMPIKASGVTVD